LQLNANFVFCFRAKETSKPVKIGGRTEVQPQGFMPIAGDEFLFEQTVNCLLLPKSGGVPSWQSDNAGEKLMMKLPAQFVELFREQKPLDESIGRALAEWAKGGKVSPQTVSPDSAPTAATPEAVAPSPASGTPKLDRLEYTRGKLADAAKFGMKALELAWKNTPSDLKSALKPTLNDVFKPAAKAADEAA